MSWGGSPPGETQRASAQEMPLRAVVSGLASAPARRKTLMIPLVVVGGWWLVSTHIRDLLIRRHLIDRSVGHTEGVHFVVVAAVELLLDGR